MNATERMALCAELDLDLNTTMAIMRSDYSTDEITAALDAMPRLVLDHWRDTMRQIALPKKSGKF